MEPSTVGASLERRVADHRMLIPKMGDPFFAKWSALDRDSVKALECGSEPWEVGALKTPIFPSWTYPWAINLH